MGLDVWMVDDVDKIVFVLLDWNMLRCGCQRQNCIICAEENYLDPISLVIPISGLETLTK